MLYYQFLVQLCFLPHLMKIDSAEGKNSHLFLYLINYQVFKSTLQDTVILYTLKYEYLEYLNTI
jgi:hypothetical protein